MLPPELDRAFRATTYRVRVADRVVDVRVDRLHPELDALLRNRSWAVVTAWNPFSRDVGAQVNASAQARLDRAIDAAGLERWPAVGVGDDGWSEESRLVVVERARALALGRDFSQWAIVTGAPGGEARLEATGAVPGPV